MGTTTLNSHMLTCRAIVNTASKIAPRRAIKKSTLDELSAMALLWDGVAIPGGGGDTRPDSTTRESLCAIYFKRREVCDRGEVCADW